MYFYTESTWVSWWGLCFFPSKGDLHFARKLWLKIMCFLNSWRYVLCSSVEPVQSPVAKPVADSYPSPNPSIPQWGTVPCTHSCTHSSRQICWNCTAATSGHSGKLSRPICQQEWLGKNVLREASGAGEPLFGVNHVKTTIPELRSSVAAQQCVLLQQEHTFDLVMSLLTSFLCSPAVVILTCDCRKRKAYLSLLVLSASALNLSASFVGTININTSSGFEDRVLLRG